MIVGTGVDLIEVQRIQHAIERWGDHFLNHVYTPQEIAWAKTFKFPYTHYAGRFAAKEAVFKALGDPNATWQDMIILNDSQGKPVCTYRKNNFKHKIHISISHIKNYALAQAIVEA